jgi:RNA polymerase sigma factor (sigma-70 family)
MSFEDLRKKHRWQSYFYPMADLFEEKFIGHEWFFMFIYTDLYQLPISEQRLYNRQYENAYKNFVRHRIATRNDIDVAIILNLGFSRMYFFAQTEAGQQKMRSVENIPAYVYAILLNCIKDSFKQLALIHVPKGKQHLAIKTCSLDAVSETVHLLQDRDPLCDIERQVAIIHFREHVVCVLDQFSVKQQELLDLLYWQGLKQAEIATQWRTSKQVVNQMVKRLLNKLRQLIPRDFHDLTS